MTPLGFLRRRTMGVPRRKVLAFKRGDSAAWNQLTLGVLAAVDGYHTALEDTRLEKLVPRLDSMPADLRGYAYEGAALGYAGLDILLPPNDRFLRFAAGPGSAHAYMIHIGYGEALALLRRRPEPYLTRLDPVLRWLALDGYGFNLAFFSPQRYLLGLAVPGHLSAYARRIFDQGVGRSSWFLLGADVDAVAYQVSLFPRSRRGDLWAGVGVACAYAGGTTTASLGRLRAHSAEYAPQLAMGAAVVAKGRERAGNPVAHSDEACRVLCDMEPQECARLTDRAFEGLPVRGPRESFDVLQGRLLAAFRSLAPLHHQEVAPSLC